jgi:CMP-N,N'-diacetyllegionaminic acid synthase
MKKDKSFLCLLLARGGSKQLPGKNLKFFNGKPLLAHTIETVLESNVFDRFILSTDSPEIAEVGCQYGVEVPFMRPYELSQDDSKAADAIVHTLEWVQQNDTKYDYVQYIFATAPLRTAEDIRKAIELLLEKDADMVISVCPTEHPAWWMNTLGTDQSLRGFIRPEHRGKNRQQLPITYRLNGSIYVGKWDVFYNKCDWFEQDTYAYIMPTERSVDIDSLLDFRLAELLLKEQLV